MPARAACDREQTVIERRLRRLNEGPRQCGGRLGTKLHGILERAQGMGRQPLLDPQPDGSRQSKIYLELGDVQVMARVKVNGKDCDIAWRPPFCGCVCGQSLVQG
jgi:hypothetical protein